MSLVRRLLVKLLRPILRVFGERLRRSVRVRGAAFYNIRRAAVRGDLVLVRSKGATDWLIPGKWTHVALFLGGDRDQIIHAVYPQVEEATLVDLMVGITEIALVRPRFADYQQVREAVAEARKFVGEPYDLGFGPGRDAFYCSELVWHAYRSAVPEWEFEARKRLGVETVTPSDLYYATDHFRVVTEHKA